MRGRIDGLPCCSIMQPSVFYDVTFDGFAGPGGRGSWFVSRSVRQGPAPRWLNPATALLRVDSQEARSRTNLLQMLLVFRFHLCHLPPGPAITRSSVVEMRADWWKTWTTQYTRHSVTWMSALKPTWQTRHNFYWTLSTTLSFLGHL